MYPSSFEYHRAGSVQQALELMAQYGDDAKLLAGGHSLLPVMKLRFAAPGHLIDIGRIPGLSGITESGGTITIGATTRHADVAASPVLRAKAPNIAEAASHIGDPLVRNMGTIGGSLAHADPAADLPATIVAANASIVLTSAKGSRTVPADDFFVDVFQTAITSGEMITAITVPAVAAGTGCAYEQAEDPASGYALVGVAVQVTRSGGSVTAARAAMTGLTPRATRLAGVEAALLGGLSIEAAASKAADGLMMVDDAAGSAAYKANLATVYTRRALARAMA